MQYMPQRSLQKVLQELTDKGTKKVKLAITDIDGVLRGKVISFDKFRSVAEKGFGFCDVVFGWDSADLAYENATLTGWHTGYPDAEALVDINSLRYVPWEDDLPFFLAAFPGLPSCPRTLLKNIIERANGKGYLPFFSQEFEWFNFIRDERVMQQNNPAALDPLTPGMYGYSILRASQHSEFFHDLFDLLQKFDVPLEGLHTETGPGVYEAAILYSDVLTAADRAVLFKSSVKEIAYRHGIIPTFMAKHHEKLPGCSGHVHQSLWLDEKTNAFYDGGRTSGMSEVLEHYIAGQLYCLPFLLPLYAPTVNSYKRLVEGAWAPTTRTWAIDNRTTALRALPGSASSTRLETRVVGSDANPYLAMAACLASGLYGIEQRLPLQEATRGNGYTDTRHGVLPPNLWEATQAMRQSELAKELLGTDFVAHFAGTREWEWRQYAKAVTDWEMRRYFEII